MHEAQRAREAEDYAIREAAWRAAMERAGHYISPRVVLADLAQVEGWSNACPEPVAGASGKEPHDPSRALFGGWRLEDWEKREG